MDHLPEDHFLHQDQFTKHTHRKVYSSINPSNQDLSVKGHVVIITGASRGVGLKGIVPAFAKASPKAMVLVATNAEKLKQAEQVVRDINPTIKTLAVALDISDSKAVAALYQTVKEVFGEATILCNNAGVCSGTGVIHEQDDDVYWRNFEVNMRGAFNLAKYFIVQLPPKTHGTIININTISWTSNPFLSGYCTSKLAQHRMAMDIATAYPNVTAVCVHPGILETDMLLPGMEKFALDSPEMVGGLAVWLCSAKARFLSGRMVCANWDVDDLVRRKDEIVREKLLIAGMNGRLGKDQFSTGARVRKSLGRALGLN